MTCSRCDGLRFVPCPRASVKTVCARSCERCHGNHMVPCPACEVSQNAVDMAISDLDPDLNEATK